MNFTHFQHPSFRKGATKIVVNDRGHLNPDAYRSASSPWGTFVGTWQMERKPIHLKTRTRLTAHLYCTNTPTKYSSQVPSAGESATNTQREFQASPGSQLHTPDNGSRLNTPGSNSSWVIIDSPPRHTPSAEINSCPASRSKVDDVMPPGSRVQSATVGSRMPTPAAPLHQSPSVRSTSVASAVDDASITQAKSPTTSQKTASQQHSRVSSVSGTRSPLGLLAASRNKSETVASSPCLMAQQEQND